MPFFLYSRKQCLAISAKESISPTFYEQHQHTQIPKAACKMLVKLPTGFGFRRKKNGKNCQNPFDLSQMAFLVSASFVILSSPQRSSIS